ncbi:MAG TPA: chromosome segregation protein SMC [Caulobacteraceae bacterium]|nr:chromosome segregation protein SMC [Caulobacteraceae bacterium]
MHFQRLRLSGFKSFVEPTEFRIEPGLTGVVGPNGCGKSNILEAMRWVMGASSAKAMRAGGMDDVIFSGTGARPSRNHAEVVLSIDNADRRAPPQYANDPVLEVVRRIDRGAGSTFRINGREVRARDVQLLFADASTGANSPALVRQGQISELIAAKPQNRRLILEEAAGVSGLHGRRHEAELRLRAAEANMARLSDVAAELETTLGRLKREARQAEKFKRLSAEIRGLQGAVLYVRWTEAAAILERAEAEAGEAGRAVEAAAREAAAASAAAIEAEAAVGPRREEAQTAGAILHRLAIENDRLEREAEQASAEIERLTADLARIETDRAREAQIIQDAEAALGRLDAALAAMRAQADAAPERIPELTQAWRAADTARAAADAEVERLAAEVAGLDADRRAAQTRLEDAESRLSRNRRALDMAKADRASLNVAADPRAAEAEGAVQAAQAALDAARAALEAAEADHADATVAEADARDAARAAQDELGRLNTEAKGLARLVAETAGAAFPPALDQVSVASGYEAALAAALGDDLNAALDETAPAHWSKPAAASPPKWPAGASPLGAHVQAPAALAAALAFTAVVDRADGKRLARALEPGARLVSLEGDLWRWDGYVARAEAARPAAIRLEQRRRLAEIEAEIERLTPAAAEAQAAHAGAVEALKGAVEALRAARAAPPAAEKALAQARQALEVHAREAARRDARVASLDETIARFETEMAEAEAHRVQAREAAEALGARPDPATPFAEARAAAVAARDAAAAARSALDIEVRERDTRALQIQGLERDRADWAARAQTADSRLKALQTARTKAEKAMAAAKDAPAALGERRAKLLDELGVAEARQAAAADALDTAETARAAAERAARAADAEAADARERRAGAAARLDAARDRLAEVAAQLRETARMEPDALGRRLAADAVALPDDPVRVEARLANLERERDAIGPVNLRAQEEAVDYETRLTTLRTETADLSGAIAKLRQGIEALNAEGRERLLAAFDVINGHFQTLFQTLFGGGQAELRLIESDDPLEAGLEIFACPPGKRLATMSLMSGGEQALTAAALIFGVFLANPAPICVLDEVDAPLDDANVERFCDMLNQMRQMTQTRFVAITHNPVTMARMDRLYGVTMPERGVSQLVSVDLRQAEAMAAQ